MCKLLIDAGFHINFMTDSFFEKCSPQIPLQSTAATSIENVVETIQKIDVQKCVKKEVRRSSNISPGPNAYVLPPTVGYKNHDMSRWKYPAYSMGTKPIPVDKSFGPGPKYEIRDTTRFGKSLAPKYTMRPKVKDFVGFSMPGPGTYSPEKCKLIKGNKPPAYSFGVKSHPGDKGFGPGPNAYNLPSCVGMKRNPTVKTLPAYSIGTRLTTKTNEYSPGPAAYPPPNLTVYKIKPPGVKIKDRTTRGMVAFQPSPGPNAYNPQYNTNRNAPKFSFGVRHWERSPPYVTKEDNMC